MSWYLRGRHELLCAIVTAGEENLAWLVVGYCNLHFHRGEKGPSVHIGIHGIYGAIVKDYDWQSCRVKLRVPFYTRWYDAMDFDVLRYSCDPTKPRADCVREVVKERVQNDNGIISEATFGILLEGTRVRRFCPPLLSIMPLAICRKCIPVINHR